MTSDPPSEYEPPEEGPIPDEGIPEPTEEEPIPASDLAGIAKWATALEEDDEAAVVFSGGNVGSGRIAAGLAAALLQHIAGFVKPLTGLSPDFTGVSAMASAAFRFAPGHGEQTTMTPSGDVSTPLHEAFEKLARLIELTDDDQALLSEVRETPVYTATNYVHLLETLSANNLTATVVLRHRKDPVGLPPQRAAVAKAVLDRQAPERYENREVVGYLYEANAKKHGFELEEAGVAKFEGTYLPELDEKIGSAWNKMARVSIRIKWTRLERAKKETLDEVTLIDVLEVLGEPVEPLI